jgi:general L-amino acid transport system permease protein
MAEVVRGGLQAIPKGQYEAARRWAWLLAGHGADHPAAGPEAGDPGIVNTFIALFKDTTLVLIIGLFDLLAIVQAGFSDPNWLGYSVEGYCFAGWSTGSSASACRATARRWRSKLHTGHKR